MKKGILYTLNIYVYSTYEALSKSSKYSAVLLVLKDTRSTVNVMTMTRVKHLTLGVLLALLIAGASLTATATPILASTNRVDVVNPGSVSIVNADIGVFWRSDTDWNTATQVS